MWEYLLGYTQSASNCPFHKYLLSTYHADTLLCIGDTTVDKTIVEFKFD